MASSSSGAGESSTGRPPNHWIVAGTRECQVSESWIRPRDVASTRPAAEYVPHDGGGGLSTPTTDALYTAVSDACKNPACTAVSSRLSAVEGRLTALVEQLSEARRASQRILMRQLLTTAEQNLLVASSDRLSLRILQQTLHIASFHDAREWLDEEGSSDNRFYDVVAKALPLAEEEARRIVPEPVRMRVTRAGNTVAYRDIGALHDSIDFEALPAAAYPAPIFINLRHEGDASVEDATAAVRLFRHAQALVERKSFKAAEKATLG